MFNYRTSKIKIKIKIKRALLLSIALSLVFFVTTPAAALTDEIVREQQRTYNAELGKYKQTKDKLKRLHSAMRAAKARLDGKSKKKEDSAATLEDIQHLDRKNPSLGLDDKVRTARKHNRHAFEEHLKAESELIKLRKEEIELDSKLNDAIIMLNSLAREIKRRSEEVVVGKLEERLATFRKTTLVEGHAEVGCGEESLQKCQTRALRSAERDATEKGSIVIVQAATQIDNFQLTKDQVKTNVQARLTNIEVIKKGWVGDSSYQYHIRAQVTPVIGVLLTRQIKDSIIREMGIVVPAIILAETAITSLPVASSSGTPSFNRRLNQGSAAENSFDELDHDTWHEKTNVERGLERQRPRKETAVVRTHKEEKSRFRTENWYALWSYGFTERLNLDGEDAYAGLKDIEASRIALSMDYLGIYVPVGSSIITGLVGSIIVDQFVSISDATLTTTLNRVSWSTLGFSGKGVGHGGFYRIDVGWTVASEQLENTLNNDYDVTVGEGVGMLFGLGYAWAISNESRILFSLNYSIDTIEDSDTPPSSWAFTSTSFNIAGLW